MHLTEGPDYVLRSGRREYKESPAPGTVVNKSAMNAITEEIAMAVEGAGLTLRTTGAADRAANWGQLLQAIREMSYINVVQRGADPTGVADSTSAFNTAIAAGSHIYVPAGTYKIDGTVTLSDDKHLFGSGYGSIIKAGSASFILQITGNASIKNVFIDNPDAYSCDGVLVAFSADTKIGEIAHVFIQDFDSGINTSHASLNYGLLCIDKSRISGCTIGILNTDGTNGYSSRIDANDLLLIDNTTQIKDTSSNGAEQKVYSGMYIWDGILEISGYITITGSFIDIDTYTIATANIVILTNNIIGDNFTNTFNRTGATLGTFIAYDNRQNATAAVQDKYADINGMWVQRSRDSSFNVSTGTSWVNIPFNISDILAASFNSAGNGVNDPYSAGSANYTHRMEGNARCHINCQVIVDTDHADIQVCAAPSSYGSKIMFQKQVVGTDVVWTAGFYLRLALNDTLAIQIRNNSGGAVNVLNTLSIGGSTFETFFECEGF